MTLRRDSNDDPGGIWLRKKGDKAGLAEGEVRTLDFPAFTWGYWNRRKIFLALLSD